MQNAHIPGFSTAFTICDFSYMLLVGETLLRSISVNENLCLGRIRNRTKWCILVVDLIKSPGGPLVKLVCHLNTVSLLFQLIKHMNIMSDISVLGTKLLLCITELHTVHMLWMCWVLGYFGTVIISVVVSDRYINLLESKTLCTTRF